MAFTLISISGLDDAGSSITFSKGMCKIKNPNGWTMATIPQAAGLYRLVNLYKLNHSGHANIAAGKMSISEAHHKLGHISHTTIKHGITSGWWWAYSSHTLLCPPIFTFLSFSFHHQSSTTHHTNATFHVTCTNLCDHHQLYPIPITLSAWHHIVDLAYDLWTTLCYFEFLVPFQLPDAPTCGPTGHKPLCHVVRALSLVLLHTNLVLVFVYHLYFSLLYLPQKKEVFPPEFRLSSFCPIIHLAPLCTFALFHTSDLPHTLIPSHTFISHHLALPAMMLGDHPLPPYCTLRASLGPCVSLGLILLASQPPFPNSDSRHTFVYIYVCLMLCGYIVFHRILSSRALSLVSTLTVSYPLLFLNQYTLVSFPSWSDPVFPVQDAAGLHFFWNIHKGSQSL